MHQSIYDKRVPRSSRFEHNISKDVIRNEDNDLAPHVPMSVCLTTVCTLCAAVPDDEPQHECTTDAECPARQACMNHHCVNPCLAIQPCGLNAECRVINSLPARTMLCQCLPGFIGNPDIECRPRESDAPHPLGGRPDNGVNLFRDFLV